ncbi:hypothetical protein, partial [Endozoicomonas sp. ONNA2]|uniref:hypothetical protein n=1 Tax=Endozoicomonas sp. ONNA2 TaxID=2828741 RepID=UPI0021497A8A
MFKAQQLSDSSFSTLAVTLGVDINEFFLIVLLFILSLASAIECRRVGFQVLRVLNWNHEEHKEELFFS